MLYISNLRGDLTILTATHRVTLTPGAGEMPDADWEAIASHPTVEGLIEKRLLEPQMVKLKAKVSTPKAP